MCLLEEGGFFGLLKTENQEIKLETNIFCKKYVETENDSQARLRKYH